MESKIVSYLTEKWKPEVILLGGSRAAGEHKPDSDWDLYLIGNYSIRESFPEQFLGAHLDVEVRSRGDITGDVLRLFYGPVRSLRVLKDSPDKLGESVVRQTQAAYEQGPTEKTASELKLDQSEMARIAAKISTHSTDPEACFSHLGAFHRMALQFWFERRGRWPLPAHKALPIVRQEDQEFAATLARLISGEAIENKIAACNKIQKIVWGL